jgi:lipopolysaccharide transport system permease protein
MPPNKNVTKTWDFVIQPRANVDLNLRALWLYRGLVWMFVRRDFITFYKQTVLGPLWYLIQPALTALTYFIIFGRIAKIPTLGIPPFLFYLSSIVLWAYFSACMINNSEIFSKNASIFGKVYFPRIVVPFSVVISALVSFSIQLFLLAICIAIFNFSNTDVNIYPIRLAFIPFLVLYIALLGMAVGLLVSALTIRFRDLAYVTGFGAQLWMYASPVVYPYAEVPEKYQWIFYWNPMTAPLEAFRWILFDVHNLPLTAYICNLIITLSFFVIGLYLFARAESIAMDTV